MALVLKAIVRYEGGIYEPARPDSQAPIRIYSNRYVEDDFCRINRRYRERLSKKRYRQVLKLAKGNA